MLEKKDKDNQNGACIWGSFLQVKKRSPSMETDIWCDLPTRP
ncbi:hypothetical protein BOH78_4368 [Pichia kudriavzevii]|uniref:Uncharacterized protein n=1 Tax=Pichia kudriavzevii TaxID=4909 RepID=A0A099NRD6_PICKU|nr:hypothetical protein JL09_g6417 [Pichia kudriavzevii]KGK34440.1 hypothetical protein JL09_g6413 [Pichia kudriavzevii]ONH71616.1 hypothetical protein BOH78_4368 [Pichia kudriavzevii]